MRAAAGAGVPRVGAAVAVRFGAALALGAVTVICGMVVCGPLFCGAVVGGGVSGAAGAGAIVSGVRDGGVAGS